MRRLVMLLLVALLAPLAGWVVPSSASTPALVSEPSAAVSRDAAPALSGRAAKPVKVHPWGKTHAPDQRLHTDKTHKYRYTYKVTAPTDEWLIELWLVDPKGRKIASAAALSESDPAKDTRFFKIPGTVVRPGRYTIKMRVTWNDFREQTVGRAPNSTFKLFKR